MCVLSLDIAYVFFFFFFLSFSFNNVKHLINNNNNKNDNNIVYKNDESNHKKKIKSVFCQRSATVRISFGPHFFLSFFSLCTRLPCFFCIFISSLPFLRAATSSPTRTTDEYHRTSAATRRGHTGRRCRAAHPPGPRRSRAPSAPSPVASPPR